jgi:hypothetical protein
LQTLEALKRKQFEKYHAATTEEQATIERNPYTIFHQALKNCEPVIALVPILRGGHFYQVNDWARKQGSWVQVAHTCNPSNWKGRDGKDRDLKPVQGNSSPDWISKIRNTKKGWWSACLASVRT